MDKILELSGLSYKYGKKEALALYSYKRVS